MFEEEVYISKEHIIRYNLSRTVGDACPYDSCLVPTIFLFFPFRNLGRRDVVPYGLCLCKTRDKMITISQPHVAQFATYHDGFAVYITASHCDAYITNATRSISRTIGAYHSASAFTPYLCARCSKAMLPQSLHRRSGGSRPRESFS